MKHCRDCVLHESVLLVQGNQSDDIFNEGDYELCDFSTPSPKPRKPIYKEWKLVRNPLECVYSDIVGQAKTNSFGGSQYFVALWDEAKRFSLVQFICYNSDSADAFKGMIDEL